MEIYVVQPGDTISDISRQYGVSAARLAYDNDIFGDDLVAGQALIILIPENIYQVKSGDTLYSIAEDFGITVNALVRNNSFLLNDDFLIPGRELVISYRSYPKEDIDVFGYAYSFINEDTLDEACLYMDELLSFSYGFNEDGSLILMSDEVLIETAGRFENEIRLVLTPLDKNGRFNNQLVTALLSDENMQNNLLNNLKYIMSAKGYYALDIDFEFIPGQYKDQYVSFVEKAVNVLGENGFEVSVALPPKVSDDQQGLLYEGIDYKRLGLATDRVFLMTYEWGYKFGPPMAVAPVPSVRKVLDYAVSVISPEKIYMGIPNYAYDWALPYNRGVTIADTIGNTDAVRLAFSKGSEILYDVQSKAPYFFYSENGIEHVVWFEDIRSIVEKYKLVKEYGFRGAGYWNLMREFRQNWMYVNQIKSGT